MNGGRKWHHMKKKVGVEEAGKPGAQREGQKRNLKKKNAS
jgi:hypothetical protein